jgi:hypothetical protein
MQIRHIWSEADADIAPGAVLESEHDDRPIGPQSDAGPAAHTSVAVGRCNGVEDALGGVEVDDHAGITVVTVVDSVLDAVAVVVVSVAVVDRRAELHPAMTSTTTNTTTRCHREL